MLKKAFRGILALALIAALLTGAALAASGRVTTTGSDLKMRSGPGTKFIIVNAIQKKNTTVSYSDYTSSNGGWYYVSYNGDRGWISASYVKEQGSGDTGTIRMTGKSYLRSDPNLEGKVIDTAHKGDVLSYTDVSYDDRGVAWYRVRLNGKNGWISSKYTEKVGPSGDYIYATGDTNIRRAPNLDAKIYGTMNKGAYALYLDDYEYDDRGVIWYYVNYNGTKGWVSSKYTEF